jgi:hypothetical protein
VFTRLAPVVADFLEPMHDEPRSAACIGDLARASSPTILFE